MDENNAMKMSPPWIIYRNRIAALFYDDDEIKVGEVVELDDEEGEYTFTISTAIANKYKALNTLLKKDITLGNVTLTINVEFAGEGDVLDEATLIADLFENNSTFNSIRTLSGPFGDINYCIFEPEVIQYNADNTSDYYGQNSELAQDIAKDIFDTKLIRFCTDSVWNEQDSEG